LKKSAKITQSKKENKKKKPTSQTMSILAAEAQEEHGENARMSSFVGAVAIADLVKTTLGPKGSDKMLVSMQNGGSSITTNDGATILKSIHVDNAAASILIDISKTQDSEVGDGTTTVCVLAGELLREAEKLVAAQIHPQTIIAGWRLAVAAARKELEASAVSHQGDPVRFRQDLVDIAMTTLSSKVLNVDKLHFAELAVRAVLRLKGSGNLEAIQIIKKQGGTLKDSFIGRVHSAGVFFFVFVFCFFCFFFSMGLLVFVFGSRVVHQAWPFFVCDV
jgi:T-complex protein 1 subunit beta